MKVETKDQELKLRCLIDQVQSAKVPMDVRREMAEINRDMRVLFAHHGGADMIVSQMGRNYFAEKIGIPLSESDIKDLMETSGCEFKIDQKHEQEVSQIIVTDDPNALGVDVGYLCHFRCCFVNFTYMVDQKPGISYINWQKEIWKENPDFNIRFKNIGDNDFTHYLALMVLKNQSFDEKRYITLFKLLFSQ